MNEPKNKITSRTIASACPANRASCREKRKKPINSTSIRSKVKRATKKEEERIDVGSSNRSNLNRNDKLKKWKEKAKILVTNAFIRWIDSHAKKADMHKRKVSLWWNAFDLIWNWFFEIRNSAHISAGIRSTEGANLECILTIERKIKQTLCKTKIKKKLTLDFCSLILIGQSEAEENEKRNEMCPRWNHVSFSLKDVPKIVFLHVHETKRTACGHIRAGGWANSWSKSDKRQKIKIKQISFVKIRTQLRCQGMHRISTCIEKSPKTITQIEASQSDRHPRSNDESSLALN